MKTNFQKILDNELDSLPGDAKTPRLLLHSCCGPCSSYVLEYLSEYFEITLFYYNPNIWPESEYAKRSETQEQLLGTMVFKNSVNIMLGSYLPAVFYEAAKGFENEPEGGSRCVKCFELRLEETAKVAREMGFDYFSTTLSVSPHKDADALNVIGGQLGEKHGVKYLFSDFKKRDGYKRSIELSKQHELYRQDYCGCEFSYNTGLSGKNIL